MKSQNILKRIHADNPKNHLAVDANSNPMESIVNDGQPINVQVLS